MPAVIGLIQILAIGFTVGLLAMIVCTAWMLIHPPRRTYAWAVARSQPGDPGELDRPLGFEERTVQTTHTQVPVWDIAGRAPDGPVVLMTHGWGSSRQGAIKRIEPIADHASRVIAWDLPGHGEAPDHARMGYDEHKIAAELIAHLGIEDHALVLFGWSMGAGISLVLCARLQQHYNVRGVVCEAVYREPKTPAKAVLSLRGMPHRLNLAPALGLIGLKLGAGLRWNGFDRAEIASKVAAPILLIHGDADPVSPIEDAERVREAAPTADLCVIEGAGHNNIWSDPLYREQATASLRRFFEGL